MTTYEIRVVDPADEALLRAWWEVGEAATRERAVHGFTTWESARRALPLPRTDGRHVLVSAVDADGRTVGAGMVFLFRHDNTHLAEVEVYVHPDHRRRGAGRALLAELERIARAHGRTTLIGSAFTPVGADSAGSLFAAEVGFSVGNHELTKTLDLHEAPLAWAPLDAEVAAALGGYRIVVSEEHVADEYVDGFCRLLEAFLGEVPLGELDLQRTVWTKERLRDGEDRAVAVGRCQLVALAVAPDGEVCGFSDVRVDRHDPRHAGVGGTLVMPAHRGHRLGLAMKLATHRRVSELFPECAYVETGNAGVNAAMGAVNDQMGYRVVEECLDVQKVLA